MDVADDDSTARPLPPGDDSTPDHNGDRPEGGDGILGDVGRLWSSTGEMVRAMRQRLAAEVSDRSARLVTAIVGLAAAAALAVMAAIYACMGIAGGLGALLGGRVWAGDLLAAVIAVILAYVAVRFAIGRIRSAFQSGTLEAHERPKPSVAEHRGANSGEPDGRARDSEGRSDGA